MRTILPSIRPLFLLAVLFLVSFQASATSKNAIAELTEQNHRVLSGRVYKILEFRFRGLEQCSASEANQLSSDYKKLPKYSAQQEIVLSTLDLYLRSYKVSGRCKRSLDQAERNFFQAERSKFKLVRKTLNTICPLVPGQSVALPDRDCALSVNQFIAELEPHCVSLQVPNAAGDYDPFPCMVGDYLTGRSLVNDSNWRKFLINSRGFLENLNAALAEPTAKVTGLDLFAIYKGSSADTSVLREEFLALINFYFSSHRSNSSYIRGFHDHIWAFVLFKTGNPEVALNFFVASRLIVDEFRGSYELAQKKQIPLRIAQTPMKGKIRHDYMAAYLACHYRDNSRLLNEHLPILLGYAYETLDFKSHIQEHVTLKASVKNFRTDTNRYRTGVYWGKEWCPSTFLHAARGEKSTGTLGKPEAF